MKNNSEALSILKAIIKTECPMCDIVNNTYDIFSENIIEKMLKGEKLIAKNNIYANASVKEFEQANQ